MLSNSYRISTFTQIRGVSNHKGYKERTRREGVGVAEEGLEVDLVVLARYMQIISDDFCRAFPHQVINIHHSFLPAFIGAKPYHRAHERGVKIIGATVGPWSSFIESLKRPCVVSDAATSLTTCYFFASRHRLIMLLQILMKDPLLNRYVLMCILFHTMVGFSTTYNLTPSLMHSLCQDIARISHRDSVSDLIQKGRILEKNTLVYAVKAHLEDRIIVYNNKCVVFGD